MAMPNQKNTHVAVEAFKILRSLYQLSTDLHASEDRKDLVFRILNNTIDLFKYKRAVLWSFKDKKPTIMGVSGREDVNALSPFAALWEPLVDSLKERRGVSILKQPPVGREDEWKALSEKTSGIAVMWIPVYSGGKLKAGLWLERWGSESWDPAEAEIMSAYSNNLKTAWKQFEPSSKWRLFKWKKPSKVYLIAVALSFAVFVYLPAVSLRVVAPCEVVPLNPYVVAAPLQGVIKEIMVKPGDHVKPGDLLFVYEDRVAMQELKVAQKQVEIIKSQYDRMRFKSFMDEEAMEEIQGLKYRLEQEEIRLKLAEANSGQLKIRSKIDGVCMVDHPEFWQGRPVQIGERVMMIFKPDKSKLRIFLPEKDNIEFDNEKPVIVILNAAPAKRNKALLNYVAPQTSKGPKNDPCFLAEATWFEDVSPAKVGSKGTAVVYGERVSISYWLLRKPIAELRRFLGM